MRISRTPAPACSALALAGAVLAVLLGGAPGAAAAGVSPAREFAPRELIVKFDGERLPRTHVLPAGVGVRAAAAGLRRSPAVDYAVPNYIATASVEPEIPNDPGSILGLPGVPGGWVERQWNFLPWEGPATPLLPTSPGGINAIGAWKNLAAVKRPGARGITVAVLDTGVAYRPFGSRFRRSPDFTAGQFTKGYDFVAGNDMPLDRNGHGTHIAGTIAEKTNNGIGLTGLAYRAKVMPVRVLDRLGRGRADEIAAGIRFAVDNGADIINMSFNFGCRKKVPGVVAAIRHATRKGAVTVASAGNVGSESCVSPPATIPGVIGVGGATQGGCIGSYSLTGPDVDLVAPGGGEPAAGCSSVLIEPIFQVTFRDGNERRFSEPDNYVGTSMAAAHVSGVAAMVLASGVVNPRKKGAAIPHLVRSRLKKTARPLGFTLEQEGAGLIDAAKATDPACQTACQSGKTSRSR